MSNESDEGEIEEEIEEELFEEGDEPNLDEFEVDSGALKDEAFGDEFGSDAFSGVSLHVTLLVLMYQDEELDIGNDDELKQLASESGLEEEEGVEYEDDWDEDDLELLVDSLEDEGEEEMEVADGEDEEAKTSTETKETEEVEVEEGEEDLSEGEIELETNEEEEVTEPLPSILPRSSQSLPPLPVRSLSSSDPGASISTPKQISVKIGAQPPPYWNKARLKEKLFQIHPQSKGLPPFQQNSTLKTEASSEKQEDSKSEHDSVKNKEKDVNKDEPAKRVCPKSLQVAGKLTCCLDSELEG